MPAPGTPLPLRALIVEDSEDDAQQMLRALKRGGFVVSHERIESAEATRAALERQSWDVVLCDYSVPGLDGFATLALLRARDPDLPFILVSGTVGEETAAALMKAGASDYVMKENLARLAPALQRELRDAAARKARRRAEQESQRFRLAMDMSVDSIYMTDAETMRFIYVNDAACRRLGYGREQLLEKGPLEVLATSAAQIRRDYAEVIAAGEQGTRSERRFIRSDGSEGWTEIHRRALRDDSGWLIATTGRDITERRMAENRIRQLNRVHAMLSGINAAIVRVRDRAELFDEACRLAVTEGGFLLARVIVLDQGGKATIAATTETDTCAIDAVLDQFNRAPDTANSLLAQVLKSGATVVSNDLASDPREGHRAALTAGGSYALAILPLSVGGRTVGALMLRAGDADTFDEKEMKLLAELAGDIAFALDHLDKAERLNYLALHDALTGLPNRTLFLERVSQQLGMAGRESRKLALVVIDIERFRIVNESLGRQAGDEALRQIAARCLRVSANPALLARIGADQFAVLMPDIKVDDDVARRAMLRNEQIFGTPCVVGGTELKLSARFGIAIFPNDGADAEELIRNAEAALKNAKTAGERYLYYARQMNERVAEHFVLENQLRRALENDEFVLHYQPKVSLDDGRIAGVEALIRWLSPELGLVPPMQFIPLMEETGMILEAGAWALRQAVRDHDAWKQLGLAAPRIAVNVSPIQLRQHGFVRDVEQALAQSAAPHGIDLELTESLVMEDIEGNIEKLKAIRRLGINIAIDDFGTGYSSLAYLARLPVNTLKIDRAFVITMLNDANAMTLVSTMITLAHSLRLNVVAEGVDEEGQAKVLRLLRCDQMQGYLYSKPLPFEQMTALLRAGRAEVPGQAN